MFTKTDMAKYENTWRMRPWEVKLGAQGNLAKIGEVLIKEWDENPDNFGIMFFKDLVAKAILFKTTDTAILKSDWYKDGGGLKAETSTYTIALLLHKLDKSGHTLNLKRIWETQKLSESLLNQIIDLAKIVREKLLDIDFRNGHANPSMFARKREAWDRFKDLDYEINIINKNDLLTKKQEKNRQEENDALNEENAEIDIMNFCTEISDEEWAAIYEFLKQHLPKETKDMKTLNKFTQLSSPAMQRKLQYPFDYNTAKKLRNIALDKGFLHTN